MVDGHILQILGVALGQQEQFRRNKVYQGERERERERERELKNDQIILQNFLWSSALRTISAFHLLV